MTIAKLCVRAGAPRQCSSGEMFCPEHRRYTVDIGICAPALNVADARTNAATVINAVYLRWSGWQALCRTAHRMHWDSLNAPKTAAPPRRDRTCAQAAEYLGDNAHRQPDSP